MKSIVSISIGVVLLSCSLFLLASIALPSFLEFSNIQTESKSYRNNEANRLAQGIKDRNSRVCPPYLKALKENDKSYLNIYNNNTHCKDWKPE